MRRLDWPERLDRALTQAQSRAFSDEYYCAVFAADVVLAMTDADPHPYRDQLLVDAYRLMREAGHETLADALAARVGKRVPIGFARRGDVVLRADGTAIGICVGQSTAFISSAGGLAFEPTFEQSAAFRVE